MISFVYPPPIEDIDKIIFDHEIYARVADDTCPKKENLKIDHSVFYCIGAYLDDMIIGLFAVKECGMMHFMVLKQYRCHAKHIFEKCFTIYRKDVYCIIPDCFKSVINFAKKVGFSQSGKIHNFDFRGGVFSDGIILERRV